jgi:phosphoribosylamine--glycine ligase
MMVPMVPAQDHKRLYDGGQGPNTGGVGAYSPTPFLDAETVDEIERNFLSKTCEGFLKEGIDYRGFIYFGLILTDRGPKLLEYNCRLGDPETQVILPLIESDLADILLCCCEGRLNEAAIEWSGRAACCVVMVSRGYPKSYKTGYVIEGLDEICEDAIAIHAGTKFDDEGNVVTTGGRVLGVTAVADTLDKAISQAYRCVEKIRFEGAYHRSDIGSAIGTTVYAD